MKLNNYKLIATDFDGTLLNDEKEVSKRTEETFEKYRKEGYLIVGVTARTIESVKNVLDPCIFDYLILNNGAYIYDVKKDEGKYIDKIELKEAVKISEEVDSSEVEFISYSNYYVYKNKRNSGLKFIIDIDSSDEIKEDIARINIFLKDQSKIEYYRDLINENYKNVYCFIMQDSKDISKWLVVIPKGLNKGVTLKMLGDELNINTDEMIFFGDGLNDLEVIETVGCSVAMKDAVDTIKEKAKYITLSNNDDGIAVFLEENL